MLIRTIRSVRQKPKQVRDKYAFGVAVGMTAIIASVWVWQLSGTASIVETENVAPVAAPAAFSTLLDEAKKKFSETTQDLQPILEAGQTEDMQFDLSIVASTSASGQVDTPTTQAVRIATTSSAAVVE
jgi:hypothetical protein